MLPRRTNEQDACQVRDRECLGIQPFGPRVSRLGLIYEGGRGDAQEHLRHSGFPAPILVSASKLAFQVRLEFTIPHKQSDRNLHGRRADNTGQPIYLSSASNPRAPFDRIMRIGRVAHGCDRASALKPGVEKSNFPALDSSRRKRNMPSPTVESEHLWVTTPSSVRGRRLRTRGFGPKKYHLALPKLKSDASGLYHLRFSTSTAQDHLQK